MVNKFRNLLILFSVFLSACEGFVLVDGTPVAQETPPPTQTPAAPQGTSPVVTTSPTASGPVTLRIWVPPQFAPDSGTPAGDLLEERLSEFSERRSDVRIEVRIKAVEGAGGLLDSLTTTSAAAPLALPDLIALPRDSLETAALKGLLHPFDTMTGYQEDEDWFSYAQQLARVQDSVYGLPFAGDALSLIYRSSVIAEPPSVLSETLESNTPLVFPAADPQALFTMALYQAGGGAILDEEDRPFLDAEVLTGVLTYYQMGEEIGVTPYLLTQFQSYEQVWENFLENRADMVVTWSSHFLNGVNSDETLQDGAIAPIPAPNGEAYSLATGWVWAMATPEGGHQELSVELAEFLTDSSFLADWTEAAGFISPRPSALDSWPEESSREVLEQIARSARLLPSLDILLSLGPPLQVATVDVLKRQDDPVTAAQAAVGSLTEP